MNIYQKLIEVRKTCEYLKKDNKGYQFDFVSSSQTLGTLRGAMDKYGLLLIPAVTESDIRDHTTDKGKHEYFTILHMTFTWVNSDNPEEKVVCDWIGQGLDSGEKGVGKALTYAEKYFLLKFFNIATDKDDPDSHQRRNSKTSELTIKEQRTIYKNIEGLFKDAQSKKEVLDIRKNHAASISALPEEGGTKLLNIYDARLSDFDMEA